MTTPKSKVKITQPTTSASTGKQLGGKGVPVTQHEQFSAVVGLIAKRYGVKVASSSVPTKNPYAMSPAQAEKVALQAGIITKSGNLTHRFK